MTQIDYSGGYVAAPKASIAPLANPLAFLARFSEGGARRLQARVLSTTSERSFR